MQSTAYDDDDDEEEESDASSSRPRRNKKGKGRACEFPLSSLPLNFLTTEYLSSDS